MNTRHILKQWIHTHKTKTQSRHLGKAVRRDWTWGSTDRFSHSEWPFYPMVATQTPCCGWPGAILGDTWSKSMSLVSWRMLGTRMPSLGLYTNHRRSFESKFLHRNGYLNMFEFTLFKSSCHDNRGDVVALFPPWESGGGGRIRSTPGAGEGRVLCEHRRLPRCRWVTCGLEKSPVTGDFGFGYIWLWIPLLPLQCCVTLDRSLNYSKAKFRKIVRIMSMIEHYC